MDYYKTHGFPNFSDGFENHRFDRISPERHKELSQRGGVRSGQVRRRKAALRDAVFDNIAERTAAMNATEEFLEAVDKVMKRERRKRARRKSNRMEPPPLDENCTETVCF